MDGDGVTREGALHLQLGSGGVSRGRSVSMLPTSPAAAALTAHHHPEQGSQPGKDRSSTPLISTETLIRKDGEKHTAVPINSFPTWSTWTLSLHTYTVHRTEENSLAVFYSS